jgi:hypothetical protein
MQEKTDALYTIQDTAAVFRTWQGAVQEPTERGQSPAESHYRAMGDELGSVKCSHVTCQSHYRAMTQGHLLDIFLSLQYRQCSV